MQPSRRVFPWILLPLVCALAVSLRGASLQVFAVVYGQVTNDIAVIEQGFDGSAAMRQKLARLVATRGAILDPALSDERALAKVVDLLGPEDDYAPLLDEVANNARSALLSRYAATGERLDLLPPSPRTTRARNRYRDISTDLAALNNAQHAGGISGQLAPFGRALDSVDTLIASAVVMPRPKVHINAVRAVVNGKRFSGSGVGGSSPNIFEVTAPSPLYWQITCRVVDRERVITFEFPVFTAQPSYDIGTGLVTLSYTPDVFEPGATPVPATAGRFWVQTVKDEVFGTFTCSGPGLEIHDGRFRIKLPPALREK